MTTQEPLQPGVSVIVCCHNSAERLPDTLEHLAHQQMPGDLPWEVIVVNNASTDDTVAVAQRKRSLFDGRASVHVVNEPAAGLSFARRCGVRMARFDCIVFCDDDNWLSENYLHDSFLLLRDNPEIGICGGLGRAATQEGKLPAWFHEYQVAYAVGPQAGQPGFTNGQIFGAGMVVRASVLLRAYELGFSSQLTGRNRETLAAGEDSEINAWFSAFRYRNWYAPNLKFRHYIDTARLDWRYLVGLFRGFGVSDVTLGLYRRKLGRRKLNALATLWSFQIAVSILRLIRSAFWPHRGKAISLMWFRRRATLAWLLRSRTTYYQQRTAIHEMIDCASTQADSREEQA